MITCNNDGQWATPVPNCELISQCTESPPDIDGAVYVMSNVGIKNLLQYSHEDNAAASKSNHMQ